MRVYQAFLFCLISTFSLSVFAAPNFDVRQDGRSLLVYFKDPALANHVIAKMKAVKPGVTAVTVYNHEANTTFVQLFEYFDDDAARTEQVANLEDMLEGVTRITERFIRTIRRPLPYVPAQEEIDLRRVAHVRRVVHMARNPEDYTRADITATIQEQAHIAIMPMQRQAVLHRLRPGEEATREDINAMLRDLSALEIAREAFVRERPAISVLEMLEAFKLDYVSWTGN
jgi:hypothetical protein